MSDETAAKPIDDSMREHATRLLLKVEQCFGHVDLRVPRETALAMIAAVIRDAVESALAEAKAELRVMTDDRDTWIRKANRDAAEAQAAEARVKVLEAALAKVPHIDHWYAVCDDQAGPIIHEPSKCADRGGQCAFAALASPSEPAGGRKGE